MVNYERSVLTYIDILGFRELVETKSAGDISRSIRVVRELVEPYQFKTRFPKIKKADFRNFSDLCLVRKAIAPKGKLPATGEARSQILRMVHTQSNLLLREGILLRGGITVGDVALSYGQLFGPAVIRGYELEHQVARFPRIVVGEEVLREAKTNPALWTHGDGGEELRGVKSMLRRDFDGEYFVDYLRILKDELDEPEDYPQLLELHSEFIQKGLEKYAAKASVLPKYKWLREYHRRTVDEWQ
ncbi:MAG: hypothetical protein ACRD17_00130, partial [Terriglobales bacterium]